jgi:hypothetical protein
MVYAIDIQSQIKSSRSICCFHLINYKLVYSIICRVSTKFVTFANQAIIVMGFVVDVAFKKISSVN